MGIANFSRNETLPRIVFVVWFTVIAMSYDAAQTASIASRPCDKPKCLAGERRRDIPRRESCDSIRSAVFERRFRAILFVFIRADGAAFFMERKSR